MRAYFFFFSFLEIVPVGLVKTGNIGLNTYLHGIPCVDESVFLSLVSFKQRNAFVPQN